jgi:hypothetical protein
MWFGFAEEHMLRPAERILLNTQPLQVAAQAIPCVSDWNGDGLKDLIVGYRYADKVALYVNVGTDAQPTFSTSINIQANGVDIQHPSSGCGAPAPWFGDYDHDGKKDLLVGTGSEGYVFFYRNTSEDDTPVLAAGVLLKVDGSTLSVGARATPFLHDWDEDGLEDLLCGDAEGNVHFFKNIGTAQSPAYMADSLIEKAIGGGVDFGSRSAVRVCDWDGDGLKDLMGSGSYNASWCRNTGSNAAPSLGDPVALQSPLEGIGLGDIDTGYRMRLEVVDWNNDGVDDVLIGTHDGYVLRYEGYLFAVDSIERTVPPQLAIRWKSANYLTYNVLVGPTIESLTIAESDVPSGGKTTTWVDDLAGAMQFYRIEIAE